MAIMKATVEYHPNGYNGMWIHERLPSGLLDVHCAGDFHCVVADLPYKAQRKAFECLHLTNKKRPKVTFYYCDIRY